MAEYVVLRDFSSAPLWGPFSVPSGRPSNDGGIENGAIPEPVIEFADLTAKEARDVARDPTVRGLAPRMELAPIRPVAAAADDEPAGDGGAAPMAGGNTWGIEAVKAHLSPFDGSGVTVAVIDSGIDADHPAFAGMNVEIRDFTGTGMGDDGGHGTHCAGTIFGRAVDGTRIGVAPGVDRAMIGKIFGPTGGGDTLMLFDAMQWAARGGANIISMSLGFDFPGFQARLEQAGIPKTAATSRALLGFGANLRFFDSLMTLLNQSLGFGIDTMVVAASGNESERPRFEISASLPSAADHVFSIAAAGKATGGKFGIARFSNTGAQLTAPGVDVMSAQAGTQGLVAMSGTSMATPHAAGVAALWWQARAAAFEGAIGPAVKTALLANARRNVFAAGFDAGDFGDGLVTAPLA